MQVLNQQLFAIMVVMAIVTTFMTTPIVMWLYAPARDIPPYKRRTIDCGDGKDDLRVLFCPVGSWNIHAMINMMEITRGEDSKSLRAYVLHLIECSDRLSSIRKSALSRQDSRDDYIHQVMRCSLSQPPFHFMRESYTRYSCKKRPEEL